MIEKLKYTAFYELILPFHNFVSLFRWFINDANTPTPHLLKQRVVKKYALKHKVHTLVETGTYLGVMTDAMAPYFKKIYTIELNRELFARAKKKFSNKKHVTVLHGDSSQVLKKLLPKIDKPCIFWLDAHYSAGITSKGSNETPILLELTSILRHKRKNVVLIDDANLFTGEHGYPTYVQLVALLGRKKIYNRMWIENNVIVVDLLNI